MRSKLLAAQDKFRGTLSASAAAAAIARAAQGAGWDCDIAPVSDGGEGFLDVLSGSGTRQVATVTGPLGQPVEAPFVLEGAGRPTCTALVESALAIGLQLAGGPARNDPVAARSTGAGELVLAAVRAGARQVVIGIGGSATTDGGLGAVGVLARGGRAPAVEMLVACDVQTTFLDAAAVFGPQKGASSAQVELLRRRLVALAEQYQERFGVDVRAIPGSGSAGGLAGGLAALGARLVPGFSYVAERLALAERMAGADLVVTGEGHLDRQSFAGKAVGGVMELAKVAGVPVLVVAGQADPDVDVPHFSLVERFGWDRAMSATGACITEAVAGRLGPGPP